MIVLDDVHKSFGEVRALRGVSFRADDGQITGILGPNGAGKTTALRILYTVLRQDSGSARIDDFDTLEDRHEVQKRIGVLPDTHGLYPRLTSRENIRYFGELHGLEASELEANIDELIRLLDMEDIAERRTEGFSTGQRVKVAIARALVQQPRKRSSRRAHERPRRAVDQGHARVYTPASRRWCVRHVLESHHARGGRALRQHRRHRQRSSRRQRPVPMRFANRRVKPISKTRSSRSSALKKGSHDLGTHAHGVQEGSRRQTCATVALSPPRSSIPFSAPR